MTTDPTADLEAIEYRGRGIAALRAGDTAALIAEVKALRARVALLENDQVLGERIITRQAESLARLERKLRESLRDWTDDLPGLVK